MATIDVEGLTKAYGDFVAVDDLSFEVAAGEVFGYLGPNGAGKTTTLRTLMGLQAPTSGHVSILGYDMATETERLEALKRVGYLPAHPSFDEQATGREILDLHESLKGGRRRAELLALFEPPLDRKIREYSTGNVQKLGIVQAFMHDPDVVVMDEPTSGLDPLLQERFNEFVRDEREHGTTILFSSHVLSEVRRICDRVAVLREGRLVTVEDIHDLLDRSGKLVRVRVAGEVDGSEFSSLGGVTDLTHRPADGVTDLSFTFTGDVDDLVDALDQHSLQELDVEEAPLEDVFLEFYGDSDDSDDSDDRDDSDDSDDGTETDHDGGTETDRDDGADTDPGDDGSTAGEGGVRNV